MKRVVVIGSGSWGTALGLILAKNGHEVTMWEYNREQAMKLQEERENRKFLPGHKFPDNMNVTNERENLLKGKDAVIFSVPSQALRSVISSFSNQIAEGVILVNTAKGIELSTGLRLSEVMKEEILGKFHKNIVILSGPTHAEEVANSVPTTILAAGLPENAKKIQELFNNMHFRVYAGTDMIGVEIGGAVKNCLAIGAGIADGLGFGDNTKAALMTRGLAEMTKYGIALGAEEQTFSGLTGIGDLIVTCASKHSRNRHVGQKLGEGESMEEILANMVMVAEGVPTVKAVYEKSQEIGVDMPIVSGIYEVIYNGANAKNIVFELMNRDLKFEF